MKGIQLAAVAAAMMGGMSLARAGGVEIAVAPGVPTEPPPRLPRKAAPAARDPNHPAVIAAQARQRRKAQRQAKGFAQ